MRLIKKQYLYFICAYHESTLESAFKWWVKNKNPACHSFCPLCQFYFRCQEDVAIKDLHERK